jgi:hypothetical protein
METIETIEAVETNPPRKAKKIYWLRMIFCSITLPAVLALFYGVYVGKILDFMTYLTEKEMPNIAWVVENLFAVLPAFLILFTVEVFYLNKNKYVQVYTQIEKLVAITLGAVAVFCVLIPLAVNSTPIEIVNGDVTELKTLWDRTYEWFFAQIIPFLILLSYHVFRVVTECGGHAVVEVDGDEEEDTDE